MLPEDVKIGDVYRRPEMRVSLADERDRQLTVLAIEVDPDRPAGPTMAVTCRPGYAERCAGYYYVHGGIGCCCTPITRIAEDVNNGSLVKVTG